MSEYDGNLAGASAKSADKRGDARRSRTIRFSDREWELVENAAAERGIPAAEYVRTATLDASEGRVAALSAEIGETIRRIYRHTYIVSTIKRDEMVREGRDDEMEVAMGSARESQALLQEQASE